MTAVQVIYSTTGGIVSRAIRHVTWGRWSHVGYLTPQQTVIDATFRLGVAERPLEEWLALYRDTETMSIPHNDPQAFDYAIRQQIGKPYDFGAVLGFLTRSRRWGSHDKWFCSELMADAFDRSGGVQFPKCMHKISPDLLYGMLWMIRERAA